MTIFFVFLIFILYLAVVNFATYRQFALDKEAARAKDQRTPEATLLWWAQIGGWGGAKYAQHKLRHKSYKQPFGSQLNRIGAAHAAMVVTLIGIFVFLAAAPTAPKAPATPDLIAVQDSQPAGAPPVISRRPPAVYRATR